MAHDSRARSCGVAAPKAGAARARRALRHDGALTLETALEPLSCIEIGPNLSSHRAAAHCDYPPGPSRVRARPSHAHRWRVAMALAPTLQKHLDQNVTYEVITHDPTMSSTRTAQACHVSGDCLAKAIVLRRDGGYIRSDLLPQVRQAEVVRGRQHIGADVALADETEIGRLFPD